MARVLWVKPSPSIMRGFKSRVRTDRTTDTNTYINICVIGASLLLSLSVLDAIEADNIPNFHHSLRPKLKSESGRPKPSRRSDPVGLCSEARLRGRAECSSARARGSGKATSSANNDGRADQSRPRSQDRRKHVVGDGEN